MISSLFCIIFGASGGKNKFSGGDWAVKAGNIWKLGIRLEIFQKLGSTGAVTQDFPTCLWLSYSMWPQNWVSCMTVQSSNSNQSKSCLTFYDLLWWVTKSSLQPCLLATEVTSPSRLKEKRHRNQILMCQRTSLSF